ncbi:DUF3203 family protein [Pseudomonas sp.]|jgi:hypothetical protein|uniref:DUF3203 family protein n=1 Tax=Pseudomonas sp. TaxID=306 RepID=UPI0028B17077|nr:DUF3203 family protein [Pseudomonas sp.]
MTVEINTANSTCAVFVDDRKLESPLAQVRVTTDEATRMSVLEIAGRREFISEPDAEHLVGAGAEDARFNLIKDD